MEQWDVICIRCGKHLFSEQRTSTAGDIHRLHETNDEFYDEIKAAFFFFFSSLFLSSSPIKYFTHKHNMYEKKYLNGVKHNRKNYFATVTVEVVSSGIVIIIDITPVSACNTSFVEPDPAFAELAVFETSCD